MRGMMIGVHHEGMVLRRGVGWLRLRASHCSGTGRCDHNSLLGLPLSGPLLPARAKVQQYRAPAPLGHRLNALLNAEGAGLEDGAAEN